MTDAHFVIADVFAERPFAGNQLAVFPDARGLDDERMQRAANEIRFSETTFVLPPEAPDTDLRLRIFTPHTELPFAGHPCVGSGFVAAALRLVEGDPEVVRFGTGVGPIAVRVERESERHGRATMLQPLPALVAELATADQLAEAAEALGLRREQIASDRGPVAVMDNGLRMAIVPLDSLATVRALEPNPHAIARYCERLGTRTLLAFTSETVEAGSTAHCRVYAPGAGVFEDPATGSANGPFGVYLARYGLAPSDEMAVEQGYEMGRPSRLHVSLGRDGNGEVAEVRVGGGVFVTGEARMFF